MMDSALAVYPRRTPQDLRWRHSARCFANTPQRLTLLQTIRHRLSTLTISPESRLNGVFGCGLSRGLRGGQNRQTHNEYASLSNLALDAHTPAVRRGDVFDQTQPQPVAVNLRRHHFLTAVKRLEDALHLRRRNAQPAVRDSDPNLFAVGRRRRFDAQPNPAAVAAVFHRVAKQILNRAIQRGSVGLENRQIRRDLPFDLETAFGQL